MADAAELFAHPDSGMWVDTGPGTKRRVMLHLDELMLVEFAFEEGAIGPLHSHPHRQASYVAVGSFEVTIDGVTETIAQGGGYIVPPNVVHGVRAIEPGRLIDSFTPARKDFLGQPG